MTTQYFSQLHGRTLSVSNYLDDAMDFARRMYSQKHGGRVPGLSWAPHSGELLHDLKPTGWRVVTPVVAETEVPA